MNYSKLLKRSSFVIQEVVTNIVKILEGNSYSIRHRVKSEDNIVRKQRLKNHKSPYDVEDIVGIRILVNDEQSCHNIRELLLNHYIPYKVSDYFKNPKDTGFKAYLIKVNFMNVNVEIQVMTFEMEKLTERTHLEHEKRKYG